LTDILIHCFWFTWDGTLARFSLRLIRLWRMRERVRVRAFSQREKGLKTKGGRISSIKLIPSRRNIEWRKW
jgi:hypothetical protein